MANAIAHEDKNTFKFRLRPCIQNMMVAARSMAERILSGICHSRLGPSASPRTRAPMLSQGSLRSEPCRILRQLILTCNDLCLFQKTQRCAPAAYAFIQDIMSIGDVTVKPTPTGGFCHSNIAGVDLMTRQVGEK